jgi:hypothetical protein
VLYTDLLHSNFYNEPTRPPFGAVPPSCVQWCRPVAFEVKGCGDPYVVPKASVSLAGMVQGQLRDAWLLGGAAAVATRPYLIRKLFVSVTHVDLGLITIKLSLAGRWRYIHMDDRLPCDVSGVPLYGSCNDPNQLWVPMLGKCYINMYINIC